MFSMLSWLRETPFNVDMRVGQLELSYVAVSQLLAETNVQHPEAGNVGQKILQMFFDKTFDKTFQWSDRI